MPGIPTSRGCEACRAQKKKCDQQKPACSRCARLKITCIGGGQRRYVFKVQTATLTASRSQNTASHTGSPSTPPTNSSSMVVQAFVSALQVTDLRYDLGTYGAFLRDIPRRLGNSQALDAAVNAITSAFPLLHTHEYPRHVWVRYNRSLSALRTCLEDPTQAQTSNTLCAIYLIVICQGWLGLYHQSPTHGEAMAYIIRVAAPRAWQSSFDADLATTVCFPVIFESIINPRIQLDAAFWEQASTFSRRSTVNDIGDAPKPLTQLCQMARIAQFLQLPDIHHHEIAATYQRLRDDAYRMRKHLISWDAVVNLCTSTPSAAVVAYSRYQAACCLVISLSVILNCLLRIFDRTNALLCNEASGFCDDIASIAESVSCHRPVGSGYAVICLMTAHAAVDDPQKLARIEKIMAEYQLDFVGINWLDRATLLRSVFETLRRDIYLRSQNRFTSEACIIL